MVPNIANLLPESRDGFLYERNYDFLAANGDLPIAGKPLSSYFRRQPTAAVIPKDPEASEAHRAMESRTRFRRLMTTAERPLMGLVPATTQQNDLVIILWYHRRPLIATAFRRSGAAEGDYVFRLKGEAFIPGVMAGEMADSGVLDALPMTRFTFT
jgi:hypothetical protein